MKVDITGRNIDITPAIRDFTNDKLSKLERWLEDVIETHVILSVEKHRHIAEIVLKGRHQTFTGTDETGDMYASIGNTVDKLEKQIRRQKDKVTDRRKHARPTPEAIALAAPLPAPPERAPLEASGHQGLPRIIRTDNHATKPMSVEDAALALSDTGQSFLVFRESASQRINVMFRRKDGNFGLIEPED